MLGLCCNLLLFDGQVLLQRLQAGDSCCLRLLTKQSLQHAKWFVITALVAGDGSQNNEHIVEFQSAQYISGVFSSAFLAFYPRPIAYISATLSHVLHVAHINHGAQ